MKKLAPAVAEHVLIEVLFVVLPNTLLLDLAGPAEAFRLANQQSVASGRAAPFKLRFVGPQGSSSTSVGLTLAALEPLPTVLGQRTWVVLLGQPSGAESPLLQPLPRAWSQTRLWLSRCVAPRLNSVANASNEPDLKLLTVCAGALLAADAGLIGTRQCTTHHQMLAELQRLAPAARVLANRVFVIDGPLASSAGITAGIDLALHLISGECGAALAALVAQVMVVYARRGAGDPALSPLLAGRQHLHAAVHRVQDAVSAQPANPWGLADMAAVGCVTSRHLARLFVEHAGCTPRAYVANIRVALAEQLLTQGQAASSAIEAAGINGPRQWRRLRAQRRATPASSPAA